MLHIIFAVAAVEHWQELQHVGKGGGGGRGGLEVHMNLMQPGVSKVSFLPIFWTFWAASYGRNKSLPNSFLLLVMKKTHTMTFLQGDCLKQNNSEITG